MKEQIIIQIAESRMYYWNICNKVVIWLNLNLVFLKFNCII